MHILCPNGIHRDSRDEGGVIERTLPASAEGETEITADSSDLNYKANLLIFQGNVQVRNPRLKLDCDRMEVVLQDRKVSAGDAADEKKVDAALPGAGSSRDKTLSRIICTGNVHVYDEQGEMNTDKLTLHFREVKPGEKLSASMFQSNNTAVTRVSCDGKVVMVNFGKEKPSAAKPAGGDSAVNPFESLSSGGVKRTIKSDSADLNFEKGESEFHGKVNVEDGESTLKCENLFIYTATGRGADDKTAKASGGNIDDDPFAAVSDQRKVSRVPTRITLVDNLELSRILCVDNVSLYRKTARGEQRAGGDRAEYKVAERTIVVTGSPKAQPWMMAEDGQRFTGDSIVVDVEHESMKVEGRTRIKF